MVDTTDIEKKSLEAHVELCAERYKFLETKLESVEGKLTTVVDSVASVKDTIQKMSNKTNDRLISWGIGIIVTLLGTLAWMLQHYVLK
jgi:chromosome segregation ATPase